MDILSMPGQQPTGDWDKWTRVIARAEQRSRTDRAEFDKYIKLYKDGQFPANGENGPGVSINQTFTYVMMLMASLYSQAPSIEVEPRDGGDGTSFGPIAQMLQADPEFLRTRFSDAIETVLRYSWDETHADDANNVALFHAVTQGLAFTKTSYDPIRNLARLDALRRDEVFVDPTARYELAQATYVIHTNTMRIDDAREFFQSIGVTQGIEPNYEMADQDGLRGEIERKAGAGAMRDMYKFYEIWCREGGQRNVYYRGFNAIDNNWLMVRPWPFELDSDDYPFSPLFFNSLFTQVGDQFTELAVVEPLRQCIEETYEFFRRHAGRGLAKKILLDSAAFDADAEAQLLNAKDMECMRVEKGNKQWDELIHVLSLNNEHDPSYDIAEVFQKKKDEILGQEELQRGGAQKKLTATQADIIDEYGKLRMGLRQKRLDGHLTRQCRQMAQICRQLTPPEKISQIVGQKEGLLWSLYAKNANDFINEYSVGISAGSTGERARKEKITRLNNLLQAMIGRNQRLMQGHQPPRWDEDQLIIEIARADSVRRPERYELPPPPPPPPAMPMPPQGMPGQPGPGGPPQGQPAPQQMPPQMAPAGGHAA